MDTDSRNSAPLPRTRKRFQFGLRSMFVFVFVFVAAVLLALPQWYGALFRRCVRSHYANSSLALECTEQGWFRVGYVGSCEIRLGWEIDRWEPQGKTTIWDHEGHKRVECWYDQGSLDGQWLEWWPNGQKKLAGSYTHGAREGVWVYWNPDGTVFRQQTFQDGALVLGAPAKRALKRPK